MEKTLKISPRQLVSAIAVIVLILLVATCQWRAAEERRRDEEIATAEGIVRVLTATFAGRTDLKVADISGTIDVTSVDRGLIFDSKQKATLPYSVDYFVDLTKLDPKNTRFNASNRTLFVEIPNVRIAPANVDWTKGKIGGAEGFWVSRRASANLVRRALVLTNQKAKEVAEKPENIAKAREEARTRVKALLEYPLNVVGPDKINVVVRFADEPGTDPSYLDASVTYNEAIAEARRRRAAEGQR